MNTYIDGEYLVTETDSGSIIRELNRPAPEVVTRRLSKLTFRDRFTLDEKRAIYTAAQTSIDVQIWLDDLNAATPEADGTAVDLDDSRTVAGVQALETAGFIAAGRAAQILGGA